MNTGLKTTQGFSWRTFGFWLVLAMAILQMYYSFSAFTSPVEFANYRGSQLMSIGDAAWVRIYASRTLFVGLLLGLLLLRREVTLLRWISLLGIVMPLCDAILAYQSGTHNSIVWRHLATIIYLLATFAVLTYWQKRYPGAA
jgi:hypothetical protein